MKMDLPAPARNNGQGYNIAPETEKARRIRAWLKAIDRDPNYARILFGLPLKAPIRKGMREYRDAFNRAYMR